MSNLKGYISVFVYFLLQITHSCFPFTKAYASMLCISIFTDFHMLLKSTCRDSLEIRQSVTVRMSKRPLNYNNIVKRKNVKNTTISSHLSKTLELTSAHASSSVSWLGDKARIRQASTKISCSYSPHQYVDVFKGIHLRFCYIRNICAVVFDSLNCSRAPQNLTSKPTQAMPATPSPPL